MHIGIILDGNGRWGIRHYGIRTKGHDAGAKSVWGLVKELPGEVNFLTLYGLSIDNIYKRNQDELIQLYNIFQRSFSENLAVANEINIRIKYLGNGSLPSDLRYLIDKAIEETRTNTGIVLSIALSYGGRDEIVRAVNKMVNLGIPITAEGIGGNLDTGLLPPLDILIRTGGEKRLSDFLLWQSAYAELFFTDTLFPDFRVEELKTIIKEYISRDRRFGGEKREEY